jgi:putative transposase
MPQSLSKVILHIIFSTKNRESWLESHVRPRVQAYLATICRDLGADSRTLAVLLITFTWLPRCRELFPRLISSSG